MWEVIDNSGNGKGWLTLKRDGVRVCDFFPFAKEADPAWVRAQAHLICRAMNAAAQARYHGDVDGDGALA